MRPSLKVIFAVIAVVFTAGVLALIGVAQPEAFASFTGGGHPRPSASCPAGYHRPCPPSPSPRPSPSASPSASAPAETLPQTGSASGRLALAGLALVLVGGIAIAGARRRFRCRA